VVVALVVLATAPSALLVEDGAETAGADGFVVTVVVLLLLPPPNTFAIDFLEHKKGHLHNYMLVAL
jgi:hypothetical protein